MDDLYLAPLIGLFRLHDRIDDCVDFGIRVATHRTVQIVYAAGFIENMAVHRYASSRTTAHKAV